MKTPLPKINVSAVARSKATSGVLAVLAFGGSVSYGTIQVYEATRPERLPANTACRTLADQVQVALDSYQNEISAVLSEEPKPKADLSAVKKSYDDCVATENQYQVEVAK